MGIPARFAAILALASVAACGGGGGSDNTPPPVSVDIEVSVVAVGEVRSTIPVTARMQVINTQAQWDVVLLQIGAQIPQQFLTPNFSQLSLIYVEGAGDSDPFSNLRILGAVRQASGTTVITVEQCGGMPAAPAVHIPFTLYVSQKIEGAIAFSSTVAARPNCQGATSIPVTRVAAGDFPIPSSIPTLIRTQAELNVLIAALPFGAIPVIFRTPDFTQVNFILVRGRGDNDPTSYVRILALLRERDGSYDVLVEFCGSSIDFIPNHTPFALYAVAPITGDLRVALINHNPGDEVCATAR